MKAKPTGEAAPHGPSHAADALHPAEGFLDALADPLARRIAGVTCRATVDGRAPRRVLGDVRADVEGAEFVHEVGGIEAAIRPECHGSRPSLNSRDSNASSSQLVPAQAEPSLWTAALELKTLAGRMPATTVDHQLNASLRIDIC